MFEGGGSGGQAKSQSRSLRFWKSPRGQFLKAKALCWKRISQDGCERCLTIGIHWNPLNMLSNVLLEMSSAGRRVCQGSCWNWWLGPAVCIGDFVCRPWKFLLDTHVPHVLLMVIQLRSIKASRGYGPNGRNTELVIVWGGNWRVASKAVAQSWEALPFEQVCAGGLWNMSLFASTPRKSFDCFLDGLLAPSA